MSKGVFPLVVIIVLIALALISGCTAGTQTPDTHGQQPGTPSSPGATPSGCATDSDCVPAECCHATSCTLAGTKKPCNLMCTEECRPGTMDCGQGSCRCIAGNCEAVYTEAAQ